MSSEYCMEESLLSCAYCSMNCSISIAVLKINTIYSITVLEWSPIYYYKYTQHQNILYDIMKLIARVNKCAQFYNKLIWHWPDTTLTFTCTSHEARTSAFILSFCSFAIARCIAVWPELFSNETFALCSSRSLITAVFFL